MFGLTTFPRILYIYIYISLRFLYKYVLFCHYFLLPIVFCLVVSAIPYFLYLVPDFHFPLFYSSASTSLSLSSLSTFSFFYGEYLNFSLSYQTDGGLASFFSSSIPVPSSVRLPPVKWNHYRSVCGVETNRWWAKEPTQLLVIYFIFTKKLLAQSQQTPLIVYVEFPSDGKSPLRK